MKQPLLKCNVCGTVGCPDKSRPKDASIKDFFVDRYTCSQCGSVYILKKSWSWPSELLHDIRANLLFIGTITFGLGFIIAGPALLLLYLVIIPMRFLMTLGQPYRLSEKTNDEKLKTPSD